MSAPAQAAVSAAPTQLAVPTFGPGPMRWHSSDNARLRAYRTATRVLGQLRPKTGGRKTIRMASSSSASIPAVGSTVRVTAAVSSSEPHSRIGVRVYEVIQGKRVRSSTVYVRPRTKTRTPVSVTIRTTRPSSRIQLLAFSEVTRRHTVYMGSIAATVVRPNPPTPVTPPPTTPPTSTSPSPPPPTPPPPADSSPCEAINYGDPGQGRLTFSDEFDGAQVDRTKWRVRDNTFLNHDQAYIRARNVSVHGGALDIKGERLPQAEWRTNANALYTRNKTRDYATGYIDTIDAAGSGNAAGNRFSQKYGYFEIRAWVPSASTMSRGIWPAFWLRADHQLGEIDALESYGAPTIRTYDPSPSYEWNSWADTNKQTSNDHAQGTAHPLHDNDPIWKGWHRYGINWSPTCLRYTYDGQTVGVVPLSSKPYLTGATFDDTFNVRLNMQIGTNYWGWADPAHTRDEFHFLVDYVRVYQGNGR